VRIFADRDLNDPPLAAMRAAIARYVAADARGETVSPPRHVVEIGDGSLVFTIGGGHGIAGFRVYQTFAKPGNPADTQIVAAWDQASAELKAIALGNRLGALRTGCVGGVAVDTMAPRGAKTLAVIGAGRQAEAQLIGIAGTRAFRAVRIWARHGEAAGGLVARVAPRYPDAAVEAAPSAQDALRDAEVVILATAATTPPVEAEWVSAFAHVTTLGPSARDGHELPLALARQAVVIATDSPQQIVEMGDRHMLAGTQDGGRIEHLGALIGAFDPDASRGLTLFLSIGLAGTEVAALAAIEENAR